MDGGVLVMIFFGVAIFVALAISLVMIVLRQVRDDEIRWWSR
ncbi:hypothetical protein [Microbispora corallina]|nr:hypothetical protein [Microbispora corallina]